MLYNIGGLWIYFEGDNNYFIERSNTFLKNDSEKKSEECNMRISFESNDYVPMPEGEIIVDNEEHTILKKIYPEQGYYIFSKGTRLSRGEDKKTSLLDASKNWNDIKLKYVKNDGLFASKDSGLLVNWNQYSSFLTMGIAFRYLLNKNNGIQIHCSSIEFEEKGLIFSAPSGTGKSTHIRLWKELYGDKVTIINEDRPAIRYIDDIPMLCGTPWSGSSDNFSNHIVPLKYIFILEQAPVNSIEKLPLTSILPLLMPRCFLPYFDGELMNDAINVLERLIKEIPVYLLKCRPDYEAVEMVQQCLI